MINNRQAGRRRGRGGSNNGGPRQGAPGRPDNGNRIDNRARGNASQLLEKYKSLAADAQRQGDRVNTEYYLQFADHYFRVLSEQRGRVDEQQPRRGRDDFDFDGDEDYGDEGEPARADEQVGRVDARDDRPREDRPREDRQRDDRPRETRSRDDRPREDRSRDDRPRDDRPREDRPRDDRPREDRPREDRQRDDRPRGDGYRRDGNEARPRQGGVGLYRDVARAPVEVAAQRRADPILPGESLESRAEDVLQADRPLETPGARRRGRPRRDAEPADQGGNAAQESGAGQVNGFEADRLPPSLTLAANDEAPAEPKPRRRRVRPAEDTPTAAE